jgi:hypothetical protein
MPSTFVPDGSIFAGPRGAHHAGRIRRSHAGNARWSRLTGRGIPPKFLDYRRKYVRSDLASAAVMSLGFIERFHFSDDIYHAAFSRAARPRLYDFRFGAADYARD